MDTKVSSFLLDISEMQKIRLVDDNVYHKVYEKLLMSGELGNHHYCYGVGAYCLYMGIHKLNPTIKECEQWRCNTYFDTIDDGDFGSENIFPDKESAENLLSKIIKKFSEINVCPNQDKLNEEFRNIGVYFTFL